MDSVSWFLRILMFTLDSNIYWAKKETGLATGTVPRWLFFHRFLHICPNPEGNAGALGLKKHRRHRGRKCLWLCPTGSFKIAYVHQSMLLNFPRRLDRKSVV